jgi:hypothetical protein
MKSVRIDYTPTWETNGGFPSEATAEACRAVVAAPDWLVRERWFFADVRLVAGERSISYSKAPVIDFMIAFEYSVRILAVDRSTKFRTFGPALALERDGASVSIRSRTGFGAVVDYVDLAAACLIFQRRFIDDATFKFPGLLMNGLIERLFREAGLREIDDDHALRYRDAIQLKNHIVRNDP